MAILEEQLFPICPASFLEYKAFLKGPLYALFIISLLVFYCSITSHPGWAKVKLTPNDYIGQKSKHEADEFFAKV